MVNVANVMIGLVFTFLGFVILVFTLGLGASMIQELQVQTCSNLGGVWGVYSENDTAAGCCNSPVNTTWCEGGFILSDSLNSSTEGLESISTASEFTPTMSLAIVVGAIITILLVFIGGALTGRGRA